MENSVFVLIPVVYVFGLGRARVFKMWVFLASVSRGAEHKSLFSQRAEHAFFLEPDLVIGKLPENLQNLQFPEMSSWCFVPRDKRARCFFGETGPLKQCV